MVGCTAVLGLEISWSKSCLGCTGKKDATSQLLLHKMVEAQLDLELPLHEKPEGLLAAYSPWTRKQSRRCKQITEHMEKVWKDMTDGAVALANFQGNSETTKPSTKGINHYYSHSYYGGLSPGYRDSECDYHLLSYCNRESLTFLFPSAPTFAEPAFAATRTTHMEQVAFNGEVPSVALTCYEEAYKEPASLDPASYKAPTP